MTDPTTIFVTSDWCIIEPGRFGLDPDDREAMPEGAIAMHPLDAVRHAARHRGQRERRRAPSLVGDGGSIALTPVRLADLTEAADRTMRAFDQIADRLCSNLDFIEDVRRWRIDNRMTWRGLARLFAPESVDIWKPASNQLMGMALCKAAASALGQDFLAPPWNAPREAQP